MTHVFMGLLVAASVFLLGTIVFILWLLLVQAPGVMVILAFLFAIGTIAALIDWYTDKARKEKPNGSDEDPSIHA